MSLRHIGCGAGPSLLALLAMTATALQARTTKVIDVTAARPLWAALDALEIMVGGAINYEDPPYENEADVQDFSTPQQRAGAPAWWRLVGPREGNVRAEVQVPAVGSAADNEVVSDLNLLLASYRQNKLPGDFKVEQANGMLYVTPTKVLGTNGATRDVTSPMTALITFPYAERNVAETMAAILDAIYKATGLRITIGALPFWPTQRVSFGASGEPARDALARLFAKTGKGPLSYRLNFAPKPDPMRTFDYVINVRAADYVAPMATPGLGPMPGWHLNAGHEPPPRFAKGDRRGNEILP